MSLYPRREYPTGIQRSEFDILKVEHKFLREDKTESGDANKTSWDEQLARKYEASLFREYAVCDLKHYKSGKVCITIVSRGITKQMLDCNALAYRGRSAFWSWRNFLR